MTIEQGDGRTLDWTGERYVPQISGNIRLEHVHRYLLACTLSKGRIVLDIACGEGYGSELLARGAARVIGVDLVPEVVHHASRQYERHNLTFVAGDCTAIPLADRSVDVVVSFETIEHHARHDEMMREITRVLRPGGLLVISSPDRRTYSDIPGYRNPFHVRELYLEELETLLGSYFQHTRVYGQRIGAGSLVAPLEASGNAPFVTFEAGATSDEATAGLKAPLYFIAIASDGELPTLPGGVLDGGDFVWPDDHVRAVTSAVELYRTEVERLSHNKVTMEATVATLGSEIDRQLALIAALGAEKGRLQQSHESLLQEIATRDSTHDALEAARAELLALKEDTRNRELAEAELREALGRIEAARRTLEAEIRIIERSHSWKLTAPLRASRRLLAKTTGLARRIAGGSSRASTSPPGFDRADTPSGDAAAPLVERPATESQPDRETRPVEQRPIPYVPLATIPGVDTAIKAIAFYLPQFHPIPENDLWWGPGFTEWQNVVRGRPQFPGHYQPHLPGELGFYDLRLIEVQRRQIELARTYGLHGFCYHHYWFGGTRLLRRPLDQLLANPDLDFPFCLCWANENWTRRWDGLEEELLIAQRHSPEDDLAFLRDIEPALRDPRYIRIDGRPLVVVYRAKLLPDPRATATRWRDHCRSVGLPDLYLVSAQAFDRTDPREMGFDAGLEFAPNNMDAPKITAQVPLRNPDFSGAIYDYGYLVQRSQRYPLPGEYPVFRGVAPMWDNEARLPGRGAVFAGSTPELYREWLENASRYTLEHLSPDAPLVFINAWNEWAEGAHLEPDRAHGYAYLQATADALLQFPPARKRPSIVVVAHDAYYHGAQFLTLHLARTLGSVLGFDVELLLCGDGPLRPEFEGVARVHDFFTTTLDERASVMRRLFENGARVALCNTSAVGDTAEQLHQAGFRVVSMVHELPGLIAKHGLERSAAKVAAAADHVVFAAEVVRDRFMELTGLPRAKTIVRPQGQYTVNRYKGRQTEARSELRARLALAPGTRILLGAGFADFRKGIDLFVEVGLILAERLPGIAMVWVGHHDADAFAQAQRRIAEAGRESLFIFPGLSREPDVFFAGADVYLLTSREDPFPAVALEALDVEVPVVAFEDAGGIPELLVRGCGVLVPFQDTRAMAGATADLLADAAKCRRLGAAGRRIVEEEFSIADYARFLVNLASQQSGPSVSVIVPNYNYARYLPARLKSILEQTRPPREIIFLDDASTDDSVAVARAILTAGTVPFRIIVNEKNTGCYRQWLRGIREATGDLLWIAEADDDCAPTLLEALVPAFERTSVVLAYCQSTQVGEHGEQLAPDYLAWTADVDASKWRHPYVRAGVDEIRDSLVVKNTIPNVSAVLMRKPVLSAIESDLCQMRNAGDWLVYVHLLERGEIAFVPDALNYHRRHSGSVTIGQGGLNLMRENLLVQQYILERYSIAPRVEQKRDACLQTTYEYLGLNVDGPPSYKQCDALKGILSSARP